MDPLLGLGLISGVSSLGSSLVNTFAGQSQSKDLMDYQYKLQQQAIDAQNLFNSPVEQLKRLKLAQLNPNLVYGSGVDGNQSSAASPGVVNKRGEFQNPLQDLPAQYLQSKQLEMQQIALRNQSFESVARRHKLEAETLGQIISNEFNDKTLNTRVKALAQDLVNDMQRQKNLVADEALTWSKTRNEDNKLKEIWANTELLQQRANLTREQAFTESVKRRMYESNIAVNNKRLDEMESYIQFLGAGTKLRGQAYDIQDLEYEASKAYKEWRKNHPNASLTLDLVEKFLGLGAQGAKMAAPFIP